MVHNSPVSRIILAVDIAGFGSRQRKNSHQVAVRDGLYAALRKAFEAAGIAWSDCYHEDRGDGVFVLAPAELPKYPFVESLPRGLAEALREHNATHSAEEQIRLRMAVDFGEVINDANGVTGSALIRAFRMLDATPLRTALDESSGVLALIASSWFYEEVIRHSTIIDPATFRRTVVKVKETNTDAWIGRPDDPFAPRAHDTGETIDFEHRYIDFIRQENSTFELFQVAREKAPSGYSFDEYYVPLPITRRRTEDADAGLTGAGTDAGNAIVEARRVLLLGGAGAGKTTFLTWLAYVAATGGEQEGPWHGVVPFYVSLRRVAETGLPQQLEWLLEATAPILADEKPDKWVTRLFASGRAMLLVDGLDEVVAGRREEIKRWLEQIVRAYPAARYVISTRPSAVDDDWFVDAPNRTGLIRFELLSLSTGGLGRIIENWYKAATKRETDPAQRTWLAACSTSLRVGLSTRPSLRGLVSSPLLACLLCALYRQDNKYLPRTRRELLVQALELLLERWDETKPGVTVEDGLRLNTAQQLVLLERFAAPMVRESELLVSKEIAIRRLERAMEGLRSTGLDPAGLLQHMLVRTGLFRVSEDDQKIEFVHRIFRDYLAASEMVKAGEFEMLVVNAHKDSWQEVVFMAAAQAREREVAELLNRMLKRAAQHKGSGEANRLILVAAACLGYADVVDPDETRVAVENAARRLIPPGSFNDARMLAKAGPFVIDLLPGPDELAGPDKDVTAAHVLRTLAMIGGEETLEKIRPFTAMHQPRVIDELLRAWREFDFSEEYARTLLSRVDFGDEAFETRRWEHLVHLRHLTTLRALKLVGGMPLADQRAGLHPLADIRQLSSIKIHNNESIHDLGPLTRCRNLRTLQVSGFSSLRDLSALADSTVERLTLSTLGSTASQAVIDLSTLAGAPLRYLSIKHTGLSGGLHPIPAGLPVTELVIMNRAEQRSLLGVERWSGLETVTVLGVPTPAEATALGKLPRLTRLVLHRPDPVGDLVRLRPLAPTLDTLELDDVSESDVAAATAAGGEDFAGKLRIRRRAAPGRG